MKSKSAANIMTKNLITVSAQDTMEHAHSVLKKNHFRHLPVTDQTGQIVGILSDRDVQRSMTCKNKSSESEMNLSIDPKHLVINFMSWPPLTVQSTTSVREVALRMLNEKISALLIVDAQEQIRGIITTDDLLRYLISLLDKDPSRLRLTVGGMIEDYASTSGWV